MSPTRRLNSWAETPLVLEYETPNSAELDRIRAGSDVVEFHSSSRLILDQSYFKLGLDGSMTQTFTRAAIRDRLEEGLKLLPEGYGLIIFDAFRTILCQRALLVWMAQDAKKRQPELTDEECDRISRLFVADPDDKERPTVPTHNSGGAIDLGLTFNGKLVDYGTDFDEPSPLSNTIALESDFDAKAGISHDRWLEGRRNRRILFHWMREMGFTNLSSEWWHYDLGDYLWSRQVSLPWIFESMEAEVKALV